MSKRIKVGDVGDSDDLQALFDEIASGQVATTASAEVSASPESPVINSADNDSDDLQDLFDSVAASMQHESSLDDNDPDMMPVAAIADASDEPETDPEVFERVGVLTRRIHDSLRELVGEETLRDAMFAIPDAKQRLNYIAQMSEQSASRVLNATDIARPLQARMQENAEKLSGDWDKLFANQLSVEEFRALAADTKGFLGQVRTDSKTSSEQLIEIMMAQDFQDLTGQVIKRVIDMAQTLERELLSLLIEVTPPERRAAARGSGLMNGPVTDSRGRDDIVTSQEQVDDLLDSLGF